MVTNLVILIKVNQGLNLSLKYVGRGTFVREPQENYIECPAKSDLVAAMYMFLNQCSGPSTDTVGMAAPDVRIRVLALWHSVPQYWT